MHKCTCPHEYFITGDDKLKNKIQFNVKEICKNSDDDTKKKVIQIIVDELIKKSLQH